MPSPRGWGWEERLKLLGMARLASAAPAFGAQPPVARPSASFQPSSGWGKLPLAHHHLGALPPRLLVRAREARARGFLALALFGKNTISSDNGWHCFSSIKP